MKSQAGPPVTGANFFNRDAELRLLNAKVRSGTHVLLAGQRRMGKTTMEIQAEAATQRIFTPDARRALEQIYSNVLPNARERVDEALEVLVHDGHLERTDGGHRLAFRLLDDWLRTRFRDHHVPLQKRIDGRR